MLSVTSAKDQLLNLQKASGYQHLNPNELRAVIEILHFVCDGTEASMPNVPDCESDAIVPDDGCRLVHAKLCVYIDSYGSRYMKCIETSRLRFVHVDLPERICIALGIEKLSDVVIEELNHEEHMQTLDHIGSVSLAVIQEKLLSRSFQDAAWSLVNSTASYVHAINNLTFGTIQNSLESVAKKLQFVKCLHTRFLLLPKSVDINLVAKVSLIPESDDGFEHRTLYFINRTKTSIFIAEPPSYISVLDIIAVVVSQVLGSPMPLPIGSLFFCPEGSDTAIVDMLKLSTSKRETEAISNGLIGKEILSKDALQVQFHPLRPFYRGEIVAFRIQNGEKLKYGRVPEDVRPSAGQALYRFKVETAPGVTESILSSQVFSFRSMLGGNEASLSTIPEDIVAGADNRFHVGLAESSTRRKSNGSQLQLRKERQYGRVSAAELVQAVYEMLSAAGVSVGVETQSLLQKTITLQEQLENSQAALLLEQEKFNKATKEADTAKAAWVCRVYLTNEVDVTIVPCGHVLCRRCSSAVSRCPFCRVHVTQTIRIFRP